MSKKKTYLSHIRRSELLWKSGFTEKPIVLIDLNNYLQKFLWKGLFKIIVENWQTNFEVDSILNKKRALGWFSHLFCGLYFATCYSIELFCYFFQFSKTQTKARCDPKEECQQCSADSALPTPFIHPIKV